MAKRNRTKQNKSSKYDANNQERIQSNGGIYQVKQPFKVAGQFQRFKELKQVSAATAAFALDTTGTVTLLNGIATGDDFNARNGRLCTMKAVQIQGSALATTGTGLPQIGRVMLVWDNAVNGAAPLITDVLSSTSALGFPQVYNDARFTVLWDYKFPVDYNAVYAGSATSSSIKYFSAHISLNADTRYIGTGATAASIGNGGLFMITLGTNAAGVTAGAANIGYEVRYNEDQ